MKVIFVRHGESRSNRAGTYTGQTDSELTELGREQAAELAQELKDVHIDVIYSSPLKRAADTAKEIAKYHKNTKLVYRDELKERHYASWEGQKIDNVEGRERRYDPGFRPGGTGETVEEVRDRLTRLIKEVLEGHRHDTVMFVSHGAVGRIFTTMMRGMHISEAKNVKLIDNAGFDTFEIDSIAD